MPRAAADVPAFVRLQVEHSGQCLTIEEGSFQEGAYARQLKCADGLDNQLFELLPSGSASFEVRAKHSGRCLSVDADLKWAGQRWCFGSTPPQHWKVVMVEVTKELYELRPVHVPNWCLDIAEASLDEGEHAQIFQCNGTDAQRWRILSAVS
ncbi:RICIN domain-containing protein [Streptomyces netropsis]|uniref:Ricin B lectin domain-containing protein n=1 Tax=Streptomyces netropsis TaxID=55404 RepID=A0A7W7L672_STRNE|nr:RICIN domain-containing protein [Streptomyces netropsis]MBB4884380.1 hypothetical protein [Streptomyces netropsis]